MPQLSQTSLDERGFSRLSKTRAVKYAKNCFSVDSELIFKEEDKSYIEIFLQIGEGMKSYILPALN